MAKEEDEQQAPAGAEPGAPEPPASGPPTIKVGDEADDDDDGPDVAARPGQAGEKPGRRGQFGAMKRSLKDAESKYAALEREVHELRGRVSAPQPVVVREGARQEQQTDPAEAKIDGIQAQQEAVLSALATPGLPADQQDKFRKQWYKLDRQRYEAVADAAAARQRPQQQVTANDMEMAAASAALQADFPKVFESEYYRQLAIAETNRIAGEKRQRPGLAHAREAAALIYARNGLGVVRTPPASAEQRARYESSPTRPATAPKDTWTPNKQQYKLAMAFTEHRKGLTDEQRVRAYYNEVLKPAKLV